VTPLQLEILLHYVYSPHDFREGDFSAPAVREAIDIFRADLKDSPYDTAGLLTKSERPGQTYTLSERGRVYIEHLLSQPLPVQTWTVPCGVKEVPRG
jgi:hypothetical protein